MAGDPVPGPAPGVDSRRWSVIAGSTATFAVLFDGTAAMMALPGLGAELGFGFGGRQWVVVAHALAVAAVAAAGGAVADRLGTGRAFRLGAVLFGAGAVASGAAGSLLALILARCVQGVGSGLLLATAARLVGREPGTRTTSAKPVDRGPVELVDQEFRGSADPADRDSASGAGPVDRESRSAATPVDPEFRSAATPVRREWRGVVGTLAGALGLVGGGALAEVDWRLVFLAVLPVGVLLLAIGHVHLRVGEPRTRTTADRSRSGDRAFLGTAAVTCTSAALGLGTVFLEALRLQDEPGRSPLDALAHLSPLVAAMITAAVLARRLGPGPATSTLLVTLGAALVAGAGPLLPLGLVALGAGLGPAAARHVNQTHHHIGVAVGVLTLGALVHHRALVCAVVGTAVSLVAFAWVGRDPVTATDA
ncbi:MFS transporter [Actinosynnema sp. NPDC059335]|uniref:MFS transporter n=1 Tax=Actinosynnema sp. NPDC059335 TaxID=3346804 RepID=UPI00367360CA